METKLLVGVFSSLLLIQVITAQCITPASRPTLAYAPELSTGGGTFSVRSSSPIAPTGVAVLSDQLVIEGPLVIDGQLPFLGTVALEGAVPSVGVGNVVHSCGGAIGITSEVVPASPLGLSPLGPKAPGPSPRGPGCARVF